MFLPNFRASGIVLALLILFTAGGIYFWSAKAPRASAAELKDSRIQALLKERLATLRDLAAQTGKLYEEGGVPFTDVHAANEAMFRAELDLAESREAGIAILEKLVAEAKKHEEHVAHLAKSGAGRSLFPLKTKAHRLEAELALEREKAKRPDK